MVVNAICGFSERACKGRDITPGCSLLFGLKRASQHFCCKDNPAALASMPLCPFQCIHAV